MLWFSFEEALVATATAATLQDSRSAPRPPPPPVAHTTRRRRIVQRARRQDECKSRAVLLERALDLSDRLQTETRPSVRPAHNEEATPGSPSTMHKAAVVPSLDSTPALSALLAMPQK